MENLQTKNLLTDELVVIAMGAELFVQPLAEQGVELSFVDWRPPSEDRKKAYELLTYLED